MFVDSMADLRIHARMLLLIMLGASVRHLNADMLPTKYTQRK